MATKRTDRVAERPDPSAWGEDELMSLNEAARLFWPGGFITERNLRHAVRAGRLPISRLSGKHLVTRRALSRLSECTAIRSPDGEDDDKGGTSGYLAELAAIGRMGRK